MGESELNPLDVLIVTVREQYYIPKFLRGLLTDNQIQVVGLTTVPPSLGRESMPSFLFGLFRRFGPRVFAQHVQFYGIYRVLDTLNRLTDRGKAYSPRTLAERHGIEYRHTKNLNRAEYNEYIESLSPDILVSIAATQKMDSQLLDVPSEGCINIHSSLLPEYRGVSPSFWTLLNDETETGITVHYMEEEIDAGDIIRQRVININDDDTLHSLNKRIAEQGSTLLVEALNDIQAESVNVRPMPEKGSYYSIPERDDVRRFLEDGNQFF
jgi:methionyl-tRNA formyltransferase